MAASRVSHLQDKVQELEDKVKVTDADDEATITALEEEVARTAAQVKGHDRQVSGRVYQHVLNLHLQAVSLVRNHSLFTRGGGAVFCSTSTAQKIMILL